VFAVNGNIAYLGNTFGGAPHVNAAFDAAWVVQADMLAGLFCSDYVVTRFGVLFGIGNSLVSFSHVEV
jgi:hypothetical protein